MIKIKNIHRFKKINQSFTKRVKSFCPRKLRAELDGLHKRKASDAMIKGQYFEYAIFKTKNREGEIPKIPRLRKGKKSTAHVRIEDQAIKFFEVCDENQIKFYGTDRTFHTDLFGFETFGTWDGYGLYKGKPVVIDIKLTQNVDNSFGDFCWGDIDSMDKIQADMYMTAGRKIDQVPYNFLYMVFDYKKNPGYVLHYVEYDQNTAVRVQERLQETESKLLLAESEGWPAVSLQNECNDCCFSDTCKSFTSKVLNKEKWENKQASKSEEEEDIIKAKKELDDLLAGVLDEQDF